MLNFIVPEEESDQTILSFLKKRLRSTPKSLVYKLFRKKKVKVNGNPLRFYHHRLKSNDRILLEDKFLKEEKINLEFYPASKEKNYFVVNYEDENILIVTKEHNVSMPSLDNSVQNYFFKNQKDFYQKMIESYFVFTAAHRLDKLTKGLVIYPKNFPSKKIIYNSISDKELITNNYLTLIEKKRDNFLYNNVEDYI